MWPKNYKDYPVDTPLKKEQLKPGKGLVGAEMHDLNGWGTEIHCYLPKPKGRIRRFFDYLWGFKTKKTEDK